MGKNETNNKMTFQKGDVQKSSMAAVFLSPYKIMGILSLKEKLPSSSASLTHSMSCHQKEGISPKERNAVENRDKHTVRLSEDVIDSLIHCIFFFLFR